MCTRLHTLILLFDQQARRKLFLDMNVFTHPSKTGAAARLRRRARSLLQHEFVYEEQAILKFSDEQREPDLRHSGLLK